VPARNLAIALAALAFALLAFAPSAFAGKVVVNSFGEGTTGGLFVAPKGVAINKTGAGGVAAGTYYVIDGGNRRLQRFSPDGEFVSAWGWGVADGANEYEVCTEAATCQADATGGFEAGRLSVPIGIAVDQGTGTVYVSDSSGGGTAQRRINAYSATGAFEGAFGWEVNASSPAAEFQFCTAATGCQQGPGGANGGQLSSSPGGLAVDSHGNVYFANGFAKRVDVFAPTFTLGVLTNMAFARSFGADVVSAGGADDGSDIEKVTVAATSGTFTLSFGTTGTTTTGAVPYNATAAEVQAALEGLDAVSPGDVAVGGPAGGPWAVRFTGTLSNADQAGQLTADGSGLGGGTAAVSQLIAGGASNYEVCEAGTTDACKAGAVGPPSTGLGGFGTFSPVDLVIDSSDHLYVLDRFNKRIEKFDLSVPANPFPIPAPEFDASAAIATAFGAPSGTLFSLGYDSAANHIYLAGANSTTNPVNQIRIEEMDSSGAHVETHGTDLTITAANGLAVAPPSLGGNIYAAASAVNTLFVLNDARPVVNLDEITQRTPTSATLTGTVDPTGTAGVTCKAQYSTDGSNWTDAPGGDPCTALTAGGGPQPISDEVTGLTEGTFYHLRLIASKPFGAGSAVAERTVTTTGAPLIHGTASSHVSASGVTLEAEVTPQLQPTTYRFEYVDDATFQVSGFAHATSTSAASAGAGSEPIPVATPVSGLTPGTTYHFRLLATNGTGTREGEAATFMTYAPPPSFEPGSCGNEEFRTGPSANLPDCRAYEQVSPTGKNGVAVTGAPNAVQAAPAGDGVTFEVTGGIPGGEGAQDIPMYLAGRSSGAWASQGILPPASFGSSAIPSGWTPDLSQFFSTVTQSGSGESGLVAVSPGTPVTTVSPYAPGGGGVFDGASEDGSRVFFENGGAVLDAAEAAAPGKDNLYLWDRESGEVSLAGLVPPAGDARCGGAAGPPCVTPPGGSFAGAYTWFAGTNAATLARGGAIAFDGTNKVSEYTQENHAISTDGASAYFTAGATGQIYLRRGLGGADPETVHVNESERTPLDPAGAQTAAFMAASADGSKAIFASPQKLTQDATTGPEQPTPAISRAKPGAAGLEDPEAGFLPAHASGIAVDGSHIYWADPGRGEIGRATLNGEGAATEIEEDFISVPGGKPRWVAADSEYVYWTELGENEAEGEGTVGRARLDRSQPPEPDFITGASQPQGIAVDSSHIYWANGRTNAIARADISGDNPELSWHFIGTSEIAQGVAVDAADSLLFWTTNNPASFVSRANLDGTGEKFAFIAPAASADRLRGIAVDAGHVYWFSAGEDAIGRVDLDLETGLEKEYAPNIEESTAGLAVDGAHLYWASNGEPEPNPGNDLYRFDAAAPAGERLRDLTVDANPADTCPISGMQCGAQVQGVLGVSADASYAYFVANGVLAPNEGALGEHAALGNCEGAVKINDNGMSGECNLYLWNSNGGATGTVEFIARLNGQSDVTDWEQFATVLVVGQQRPARVTPDGRTLLFRSTRRLTDYDNHGTAELYRYRVPGPGVTCVTCNPTGTPPTSEPDLQSIRPFQLHTESGISLLTRNLSADGNRVFFETAEKLVAADTNGDNGCPPVSLGGGAHYPSCLDVYEWEANGAGSCHSSAQNGGCLYLLSPGTGGASFFGDADEAGDNVFIFTQEALVPADGDQIQDVYDVRVEGGLATQHASAPPPCEGEGCRGAGTTGPPAQGAGSAGFSGPESPAPHHKKHKHNQNKRHKKKHHKPRANHNRRASR
jgi:hypothetical protein